MTTKYLTADDFLTGIVGQATDFRLDGLGMVQLRPLSLLEVQRIRKDVGNDEIELTVATVAAGLVQPRLSETDIVRLHDGQAGTVAKLSKRIMEISGMFDGATQEQAENLAGGGS